MPRTEAERRERARKKVDALFELRDAMTLDGVEDEADEAMFELTGDEWKAIDMQVTGALPTYSVTYYKHPQYGWVPSIPDDMPASLAAYFQADEVGEALDALSSVREGLEDIRAGRVTEFTSAHDMLGEDE